MDLIVAICGKSEVAVPAFMVTVAESADGGNDDDEWGYNYAEIMFTENDAIV